MGTGAFARPPVKNSDYEIGYLCGVIRGDGLLRLWLADEEALQRTQDYLRRWEIDTQQFVFQRAAAGCRPMQAIRTHARPKVEQIRSLIAWPTAPSREWSAGFLAGIYDAEGSYNDGILRISNTDSEIIASIARCLRGFDFRLVVEHVHHETRKPIDNVRLLGGLREHLRFFHSVDPAIVRKRDISGQAVKSDARLGVVSVEPLGRAMRLYDITTESGDFVANGVISHNCYARPSHAYLGLSPGLDFETRIFAKTNAAELLRKELAAPGYRCSSIALGANTDPYQPAERELRITRSILEVLAECEHPFTIVTKSALVERDIDLIAPMAAKDMARVYVSVTNLDAELARKLEPRASAPYRRLEAIKRLVAAGIPSGVVVAPVIPFITDRHLEEILERAREAGATEAGYILLRLPHEVAPLFKEWLATHYPLKAEHVVSLVRQMRGGKDYDSTFGIRQRGTGNFAELIGKRFALACERLGLNAGRRGGLDTSRFRPPRSGPQRALF
jgi:DNA repair photolyase